MFFFVENITIILTHKSPNQTTATTNTMNEAAGGGVNVQVAVRCRPVNAEERKTGQPLAITCQPEAKNISVAYGPPGKKITKAYNFDRVFGMYSTQEEVFSTVVRPIVDEALAGFNCTIFAYGQTGELLCNCAIHTGRYFKF